MIYIFIILTTMKVVANWISTYFAFAISRFKNSPTWAYRFISLAFLIWTESQIKSLILSHSIVGLFKNFSGAVVVITQVEGVVIALLFLIGVLLKYRGYKDIN